MADWRGRQRTRGGGDGEWHVRSRTSLETQRMASCNRETGWQEGDPQSLLLSQNGLVELSELQVDSILGTQNNF